MVAIRLKSGIVRVAHNDRLNPRILAETHRADPRFVASGRGALYSNRRLRHLNPLFALELLMKQICPQGSTIAGGQDGRVNRRFNRRHWAQRAPGIRESGAGP
jgi:hypothetical protein